MKLRFCPFGATVVLGTAKDLLFRIFKHSPERTVPGIKVTKRSESSGMKSTLDQGTPVVSGSDASGADIVPEWLALTP